jgi:ABC-type phosphate transport system permease subunit
VALAAAGLQAALRRINPQFRARNQVERWVAMALFAAAAISILTTAGIVFSVLFESLRFFQRVPVTEFLFGTQWSPQTAIRADQVGSTGAFGAVPLFAGTLLITTIAMLVAGPIGMLSAIYLSSYASPASARSPSRSWRSWPAYPPSCSASSRRWSWPRSSAGWVPRSGWRSPRRARWPPAW